MENLRISAISYLNTVPFIYGIKASGRLLHYELFFDVPSSCAEKLKRREVDVGIVPVAAIQEIPGASIVSDYCIGAVGPVKSVILVSLSPIDQVHTIHLDPDSRTSVRLIRILASNFWMRPFKYGILTPENLRNLSPGHAAVVIGDKTFGLEKVFPFVYDLAEQWIAFTGLPFTFACWVSAGRIPGELRSQFNEAIKYGVEHLGQAAAQVDPAIFPNLDIGKYLSDNISYPFDEEKKRGLEKFLQLSLGIPDQHT